MKKREKIGTNIKKKEEERETVESIRAGCSYSKSICLHVVQYFSLASVSIVVLSSRYTDLDTLPRKKKIR